MGHLQPGSVGDLELGDPEQRLVTDADHRVDVGFATALGGDGHGDLAGRIRAAGPATGREAAGESGEAARAGNTAAEHLAEGPEQPGERVLRIVGCPRTLREVRVLRISGTVAG